MLPLEQRQQSHLNNNSTFVNELDGQRYYSTDMYGQLIMNNPYTPPQTQTPQSLLQSQHYHQQYIRTVYLGNVSIDISVSDIMDQVKTGPIQAIRPLPEKNGLFITFIDSNNAAQFYYESIRNRLNIHGHELKIGWGKPTSITTTVQSALQNGASRNVYLGLLDEHLTEYDLRQDLSRFGHIEHVKIIPEKRIAFVHFLCITNAVKCVNTLPTESTWQSKRVNFGKDRCAAQQKLFISPPLTTTPMRYTTSPAYDMYSGLPIIYQQQLQQRHHHHHSHSHNQHQPLGGIANRTIYLGNIHPDTTSEDICNVIRGGILSQIRFMPDKHIAFITFVDPTLAENFFQTTSDYLVIKNRRLKLGWGKPSALPLTVLHAVQNGASRNVYIGNIDDLITEDKLKHDFSEYGDIELVNTLKEKNCAFVNFTSIAGAVRAIEGIRSKEEYKKFRINYGKDRCGNQPRFQYQQGEEEEEESKLSIKNGSQEEEYMDQDEMNNNNTATIPNTPNTNNTIAATNHDNNLKRDADLIDL